MAECRAEFMKMLEHYNCELWLSIDEDIIIKDLETTDLALEI